MTTIVRVRHSLEYKQDADRLVQGGRATVAVARDLRFAGQTVNDRMKAQAVGRWVGVGQALQRRAPRKSQSEG